MLSTRTFVIRAFVALALARAAAAQTPVATISPSPILQFWDLNGKPLSGGQICVYAAGTTTPVSLFKDAAGTVPWGNPITLDASGRAVAYVPASSLKFVLRLKGSPNNCSSGNILYTVDNVQDQGLRLRTDLATPGANVPDQGLEIRTDLAAPTGAGLMGYGQTTTYAAGTVGQRLERVINVADAPYNAKADGTGTAGTDQSAAFQQAINDLNTRGGGGLFVPWAPKCYWAQGIILYSNITVYSDSQSTCMQKPAGTTATPVFTTGNMASGGLGVSGVHIDTLTIDGNKANQTFPSDQNGVFGVALGGCTNCSIENSVIKNNYTDGIFIAGSGSTTTSLVANAVNSTATVTGVTWAGNVATFTCSAACNMNPVSYVTTTGMTPSGYNVTLAQTAYVPGAATFQLPIVTNPGAYVSGGTATWNELQWVSGEPISNMQTFAVLSGGNAGECQFVSVNQALNKGSCTGNQGVQSGVAFTIGNVATNIGNNIDIGHVWLDHNGRNGISHLCTPHTVVHDSRISYTSGIQSGPWAGIDMEVYQYGCKTYGSQYNNLEIDHDQGAGISLIPETTYDPLFSPLISNINAHDNSGAGTQVEGPFGPAAALTESGTFTNNAGGDVLIGWSQNNNVLIPWISSQGSPSSVVLIGSPGSVTIEGGTISATGCDIAWSNQTGFEVPFLNIGANLIIGTGGGWGGGSTGVCGTAKLIVPMLANLDNLAVNCIPVWSSTSPRTGLMACNGQIYSVGGPGLGVNPGIGVTTDGMTHTGKLQWDNNAGSFNFGSQTNDPVQMIVGNSDTTKTILLNTDGTVALTHYSGPGNLPLCFDSTGKIFAGSNVSGVAHCP